MAKKRKNKVKANGAPGKAPEKVGAPAPGIAAGYDRDILNKAHQGLLKPQDATLATRGSGKGLAIYDDIERDCHAYAVLQKRKLAVVSFPWEIDPATDDAADEKAADGIREMLDGTDLDGLSLNLLDAILKGYAVVEVEWDPETWAPLKFHPRDQRRFVFDEDCQPRLLTPDNRQEGVPLPERKFIIHRFGAKDGNPYGLGLGTRLFWPATFKRQGLAFWLVFAEKFGGPTALGKFPITMSEEQREELKTVLGRLSQETAIVAPLETEIQLLDVAKSGSIDTYDRLLRYMDEEMSKAVLGETLTTSIGDTGSYAAAQTHNGVRMELIKADSDLLSATLNSTLMTWLTEFHFPGANPPRLWRRVEAPKDEKAEADKDLVIFNMGFTPDEEFIQKKYGDGWKKRAGGFESGYPGGGEQVMGDHNLFPGQDDPGTDERLGAGPEAGAATPQTPPGGVSIQDTALNGEQVSSLLGVIQGVSAGNIPKESAVFIIRAAFPGISPEMVTGMIDPIEIKEPEPAPVPTLPHVQNKVSEFAEQLTVRTLRPVGHHGRGDRTGARQPDDASGVQAGAPDADIITAKAEAAALDAMDRLLEPAKALVASATSFSEILDGLADLYPDMDGASFAKVLETAIAAANLAGAVSVRA